MHICWLYLLNSVVFKGCRDIFDCCREISVEDQEMLSKFLPLLREYVPGAVEDIESDICSHASRQGFLNIFFYLDFKELSLLFCWCLQKTISIDIC